jgi:transcriptional regulator with XRE-family HTH domain
MTCRLVGRPTNVARRTGEVRRALGGDLRTAREDAGVTQASLARTVGISAAHLCGIEAGRAEASTEVLVRIADALGASVSVRVFPGTGPRIRDHISAAITDALIRELHPRWRRFPEVPVYRPVRGVIDVVLHDSAAGLLVASEIQSELRRLEQIVRWSNQKRDALPSADLWQFAANDAAPATSSLLVIRSTRANRAIVDDAVALLTATYPAGTANVAAALRGLAPWPGPGIVWATVEASGARILDGPPRGGPSRAPKLTRRGFARSEYSEALAVGRVAEGAPSDTAFGHSERSCG